MPYTMTQKRWDKFKEDIKQFKEFTKSGFNFVEYRENISNINKILVPEDDKNPKKDGFLPIDAPVYMIFALFDYLEKMQKENEKLQKMVDGLVGYTASKELMQNINARLKDLEEKNNTKTKKVLDNPTKNHYIKQIKLRNINFSHW